jgi:DNA-binding SARP family transcriptional activator
VSPDRLHGRARSLVCGNGALVALAILVVGVPLGLAQAVGWPLPHQVPTVAGIHSAFTTRGIPDQTLLDGLACLAWLAWASAVLSIAEEVVAAARGRGSRRIPVAGAFQPVAARLVAAVLFASLALARPMPTTSPPVRTPLALQLRPESVALDSNVVSTAAYSPPALISSPVGLPAGTTSPVTYVVVRHDTLWTIAQTQLGDPLRWREIFALNEGRLQPDGRALTDPSWIYPGWVLELPVAPPAPTKQTAPVPSAFVPTATSLATPASAAPSTTTAPSTTPPNRPVGSGTATPPAVRWKSQPVVLPSGSVVAPSFASGVLAAVVIGRLRRRRSYRPSEPQPGRDLRKRSLGPVLFHLRRVRAERVSPEVHSIPESEPTASLFADSATQPETNWATSDPKRPGVVEIGTRDGIATLVDISAVGGLTVIGPLGEDSVRAWCAALLAANSPGAIEVMTFPQLARSLFPGLRTTTSFRIASTPEALLVSAEAEAMGRARRLAEADLPDVRSYREVRPEDPIPLLVVVTDRSTESTGDRWRTLCRSAPRLDVAVVFLGNIVPGLATIEVNTDRKVIATSPGWLAEQLQGATLFGVGAQEAVELINLVAAAYDDGSEDDVSEGSANVPLLGSTPDRISDDWLPEAIEAESEAELPIEVRLLGPYRITAHGDEVTKGLRSSAKELLAWFLLRPEGATAEAAVDALWPDTDPELVSKRFWRALGDLRSRLRGADPQERSELLVRSGSHYRPDASEITCDLWDFQHHLSRAARSDDADQTLAALRRAVDTYRGDFAADADYLWVEQVREDLHRRALDAYLRLAELEEEASREDAAVEVLRGAIVLDPYAEEAYRRLMALYGRIGRVDSIRATWQELQRSLGALELDPESTSVRLYHDLLQAGDRMAG